ADDEAGLKLPVQSLMQHVEDQAQPRTEPAHAEERAAPPAPAGGNEGGEPAPRERRISGQPTVHVEGAQVVRGVLTQIECAGGKWTIVLNNASGLLRFAVTDKSKLEFYSQDPSFEGSVNCGQVMHTAFVYYKPLPGNQTRFAGEAVAIEFTK